MTINHIPETSSSAPLGQQTREPQTIEGFAWLLLFWVLGAVASIGLNPKIPAAIFGLFGLFLSLHVIPERSKQDIYLVGDQLLKHMTLFFIPAGAGLYFLPPMIHAQLLGVLIVMAISTGLSIAGCALLLRLLCSPKLATENTP